MAAPDEETIEASSTDNYVGFGADFTRATDERIFELGARTSGMLKDVARSLAPLFDEKNIKSGHMEYVYGEVHRFIGDIKQGMYAKADSVEPYLFSFPVEEQDPWEIKPDSKVMAICNAKDGQYAWCLVLNGDSLRPINPFVS